MILFGHDSEGQGGATHLNAILVIEDDPNDFNLAQRELIKLKVRNPIHHVSTVEEMIAYLKGDGIYADREQFPLPVVILLDMHLASADGLDAAAWVRSKLKFRNIPIIAISGSGTDRLQLAVEIGADALMQKPLNGGEFRRLVSKLKVPLEFAKE
jgi:CheY-like chemotaxis protein